MLNRNVQTSAHTGGLSANLNNLNSNLNFTSRVMQGCTCIPVVTQLSYRNSKRKFTCMCTHMHSCTCTNEEEALFCCSKLSTMPGCLIATYTMHTYVPDQHEVCTPRTELEYVAQIKAQFVQAILYTMSQLLLEPRPSTLCRSLNFVVKKS